MGIGNEKTDMMKSFYMEDEDVRKKYLGNAVSWHRKGDDEARKALETARKTYDGKAYNMIKGYALSKMLQSKGMADDYLKSQMMAAIMIAAYKQNALGRTELSEAFNDPGGLAFNGWMTDKEGIKSYLESAGITDASQLSKFYALLNAYDAYFMLNDGSFLGYPNSKEQLSDIANEFGLDGYHKNGKNYIPRDNYRALLHKGEMVLNEREAEFYRQMFPYGGESDKTPRAKGKIITGLPWVMTAGYPSYPSGSQHRGVDFGIPVGTKVGAAMSGVVVGTDSKVNYNTYASGVRSFGQYVLVKGDNNLYYRYGHLSKIGVTNGQQIKAGDTIGLSGNTGYSTGPHLHFQVQTGTGNSTDISPYSYITSGLFQAKGDINIASDPNSSKLYSASEAPKVTTGRFISGANAASMGGGEDNTSIGGADKVVNSVDGGFNRLISYLENISKRQDEQQILLEAFSKSRTSSRDF